jgi:hypothetical protein
MAPVPSTCLTALPGKLQEAPPSAEEEQSAGGGLDVADRRGAVEGQAEGVGLAAGVERHRGVAGGVPVVAGGCWEGGGREAGGGEAEGEQLAAPVPTAVQAGVGAAGAVAAAVVVLRRQDIAWIARVDRHGRLVLRLAAAEEPGSALVGALLVDADVAVVGVVAAAGAGDRRRYRPRLRRRGLRGGLRAGRAGGLGGRLDGDRARWGEPVGLGVGGRLAACGQHRRSHGEGQQEADAEADREGSPETETAAHGLPPRLSDSGPSGRVDPDWRLLPRCQVSHSSSSPSPLAQEVA